MEAEVSQPLIGRVIEVFFDEVDKVMVMNIIVYDHSGNKIGRSSPPEGGPKGFEPCLPCARYEVIEPPVFPLRRDFCGCWRSACKVKPGS